MRDELESLVQEMLDRGILFEDARREFEKVFITRALQRTKGSVGNAAKLLGLHRNTLARKMTEYRIKEGVTSSRRSAGGLSGSARYRLAVSPCDCLTSPRPSPIELAVARVDC